ncbi:beta-1,3-glucan-binding protein 1-like isoform X2 [Aricia agestis]|uniref:beta-1,3-glucan-binding protein 1-like isoform X2 n=1 Tax=Aricia agestis TaxID=91739 RepID=UPI001C204858|nr:beta-1,3-glucan-binding protein 1-like isoform X2 [Aricia agestis]XP_041986490.1 beta-1,3-glucan-binding protein 1-like isoform X2 [Aricia agestis]
MLFLLFTLFVGVHCYEVPQAKLEAIYPTGLRVSIPDEGFTLFAFHGKLNEEMDGLEGGQWSRDINVPKNGRWTFLDPNAKLQLGDKVYFWTYVIYNGLGYRQDDGEWTVTEFVNQDGIPVNDNGEIITTSTETIIQTTADNFTSESTTESDVPTTTELTELSTEDYKPTVSTTNTPEITLATLIIPLTTSKEVVKEVKPEANAVYNKPSCSETETQIGYDISIIFFPDEYY